MRLREKLLGSAITGCLALTLFTQPTFAASHREAPITALDQKADITDWYSFVDPANPGNVVFIMNVDPFLEPSNGPNYFPFDPALLYEMKIDNNQDGVPDVIFQFRFATKINLPNVFTGYVGNLAGIPPITSLSGAGATGLSLSQTYTVTMITNEDNTDLTYGQTLYAVPSNVGPRTMPNYNALFQQGIYTLPSGIKVFAGTVADPFFIDLGAAFDSLNFRAATGGGVLPAAIDADDANNYAPNTLAGFNVNSIAIEVPITMLTVDGAVHPATAKQAVIGSYATTSRAQSPLSGNGLAPTTWVQVQRMGNPLINELIIGTGHKNTFSTSDPTSDSQFANFFLDPLLATIFGSIGVPVPPAPRYDLLPLVTYAAPICPGCKSTDAGPIADLLRLNTGLPPTAYGSQKRLGFLAGDNGFPNGRRPIDDVVDIAARAVAGVLAGAAYNTPIGDGVNAATQPASGTFPFVTPAYDGRNSVHVGPGQAGCSGDTSSICPTN